jgi:hypothetical protein
MTEGAQIDGADEPRTQQGQPLEQQPGTPPPGQPPTAPPPDAYNRMLVKTWRYLRFAMIALPAGLGISIVWEYTKTPGNHCLQGSISAYYYTPVGGFLVGTLVALGICLFALRGNTDKEACCSILPACSRPSSVWCLRLGRVIAARIQGRERSSASARKATPSSEYELSWSTTTCGRCWQSR